MGTFYGPSISPDEIYHWKYKSKFRRGGRWVYIYDDGSMSEDTGNNLSEKMQQEGFGNNIKVKKGDVTQLVRTEPNRLFTYKEKAEDYGDGYGKIQYVRYGRLHMARMNAERHVSDAVEKGAKVINKGRKKIQKLLGSLWK